jgi:hypothetical protein
MLTVSAVAFILLFIVLGFIHFDEGIVIAALTRMNDEDSCLLMVSEALTCKFEDVVVATLPMSSSGTSSAQ